MLTPNPIKCEWSLLRNTIYRFIFHPSGWVYWLRIKGPFLVNFAIKCFLNPFSFNLLHFQNPIALQMSGNCNRKGFRQFLPQLNSMNRVAMGRRFEKIFED